MYFMYFCCEYRECVVFGVFEQGSEKIKLSGKIFLKIEIVHESV